MVAGILSSVILQKTQSISDTVSDFISDLLSDIGGRSFLLPLRVRSGQQAREALARLLEAHGLRGGLPQESRDGVDALDRIIGARIGAALVGAEQDEIALPLVGGH